MRDHNAADSQQDPYGSGLKMSSVVLKNMIDYSVIPDAVIEREGHTLMVFEAKGSNTLGLVRGTFLSEATKNIVLSKDTSQSKDLWIREVTAAMLNFPCNETSGPEYTSVYGALEQTLMSMLVTGANEGVLHDFQTFVFISLRDDVLRTTPPSTPSTPTKTLGSAGTEPKFHIAFDVRWAGDSNPTIQQIIAHKLQKSVARMKECNPESWANARKALLRKTLQRCGPALLLVRIQQN